MWSTFSPRNHYEDHWEVIIGWDTLRSLSTFWMLIKRNLIEELTSFCISDHRYFKSQVEKIKNAKSLKSCWIQNLFVTLNSIIYWTLLAAKWTPLFLLKAVKTIPFAFSLMKMIWHKKTQSSKAKWKYFVNFFSLSLFCNFSRLFTVSINYDSL